jgi:class 3 adenylate cyclase
MLRRLWIAWSTRGSEDPLVASPPTGEPRTSIVTRDGHLSTGDWEHPELHRTVRAYLESWAGCSPIIDSWEQWRKQPRLSDDEDPEDEPGGQLSRRPIRPRPRPLCGMTTFEQCAEDTALYVQTLQQQSIMVVVEAPGNYSHMVIDVITMAVTWWPAWALRTLVPVTADIPFTAWSELLATAETRRNPLHAAGPATDALLLRRFANRTAPIERSLEASICRQMGLTLPWDGTSFPQYGATWGACPADGASGLLAMDCSWLSSEALTLSCLPRQMRSGQSSAPNADSVRHRLAASLGFWTSRSSSSPTCVASSAPPGNVLSGNDEDETVTSVGSQVIREGDCLTTLQTWMLAVPAPQSDGRNAVVRTTSASGKRPMYTAVSPSSRLARDQDVSMLDARMFNANARSVLSGHALASRGLSTPHTVPCIQMVGSALMKVRQPEASWVPTDAWSYDTVTEIFHAACSDVVVNYLGDVIVAVLDSDDATRAIHAAIQVQKAVSDRRGGKDGGHVPVGIASGKLDASCTPAAMVDYPSSTCDRASRLCGAVNASVILIDRATAGTARWFYIRSYVGEASRRTQFRYPDDLQAVALEKFDQPVECYEVHRRSELYGLESSPSYFTTYRGGYEPDIHLSGGSSDHSGGPQEGFDNASQRAA